FDWLMSVAPRAGAWIETLSARMCAPQKTSPLAQGRGSKPVGPALVAASPEVAPRAGAWIETDPEGGEHRRTQGRPSRRGVDRNYNAAMQAFVLLGRPSRRGVDRNAFAWWAAEVAERSPLAQGRGSKLLVPRFACAQGCRPSRRGVDR